MDVTMKIPIDLDRLQVLIKQDSYAYREEFYQQFDYFKALYQVLLQHPSNDYAFLSKLILFLSNVVYLYIDVSEEFSNSILHLLREFETTLKSTFIFSLCKSVVILRKHKVINIDVMVELFVHLFTIQNKSLRKFIFTQLTVLIRKVSIQSSIKSNIQNILYSQFSKENDLKQFLASELTIELFNRNILKNEKSVFLLQIAALSKVKKISVNAVKFFVHPVYADASETSSSASSSSSEDDFPNISILRNRKRRKLHKYGSKIKSRNSGHSFYAIDLVRDPIDFTTNLMKRVESKYDNYDNMLEKISLLSLLIWTHKLVVPQFYTYIQRYLKPYQQQITRILTYLSQAVHESIDVNILDPLVQAIISNFITDRNTPEAITVGLNTIREIALKCPGILTQDLLTDLIQYRKYKNKNVVMASRSLLQLYRQIDRDLLPKRDRGKPEEYGNILLQLNDIACQTKDYIPGVILLESGDRDLQDNENLFPEKIVENARVASQSRILSQSEHAAIKRKKTEQLLNPKLSNQQLQLNYRLMKERNGIISVSDVEFLSKKSKGLSPEVKVKKGRPQKVKLSQNSSLSKNKKRKGKNFMMVSHGRNVSSKRFKIKKKTYQAKNYKIKRLLTKEYKRMRSSKS
ncbi:Protein SDA1-like protein isoform X1 [Oopsacas minuta]|uniref:Protein SDA1 n=1 Tax=Oopsacas minuta TaxID=111878 RepID=A0AAV7JTW0_9METZ|nr:Protein SDA1-like protein isoform X1 [Oopsacas minuta]